MNNNPEQKTDIEKIIKNCRTLEADHKPGGWPAIQMCDISALCDAVENIIPALDLLQVRLEQGAEIKYQNGHWQLLESGGGYICSGRTIRGMLINLIFVDC